MSYDDGEKFHLGKVEEPRVIIGVILAKKRLQLGVGKVPPESGIVIEIRGLKVLSNLNRRHEAILDVQDIHWVDIAPLVGGEEVPPQSLLTQVGKITKLRGY